MTPEASALAAAIAEFFETNEWPISKFNDDVDPAFTGEDTENVSITSVRGDNGTWPVVVALVGDGPTHLVVQSILPPSAPQGNEVPTLELVARLNDGLVDGCFEMDFDDGAIRLRSSVPVLWLAGVAHDKLVALVDETVTNNVIAADHFIPAFVAVIEHGVAPGIAVVAVENDLDPTSLS